MIKSRKTLLFVSMLFCGPAIAMVNNKSVATEEIKEDHRQSSSSSSSASTSKVISSSISNSSARLSGKKKKKNKKKKKKSGGSTSTVSGSLLSIEANPKSGYTAEESLDLTYRFFGLINALRLFQNENASYECRFRRPFLIDNLVRSTLRYMSFYKSRNVSYEQFVQKNVDSGEEYENFKKYLQDKKEFAECNEGNIQLSASMLLDEVYDCLKDEVRINGTLCTQTAMSAHFYHKALSNESTDQSDSKFGLLLDAIRAGDEKRVTQFLKNGANVAGKDDCGCTPLHYAVLHHQAAIVDMLLKHKAPVNEQENYGRIPLLLCSKSKGQTDCIEFTKAIQVSRRNVTQAQEAIGKLNKMQKSAKGDDLIKVHTKVIEKSESDILKMQEEIAVRIQRKKDQDAAEKIYKSLVSNGADINSQNKEGNTPLATCAYRLLHVGVLACLQAKACHDVVNNCGQTALVRVIIGSMRSGVNSQSAYDCFKALVENAKSTNVLSKIINIVDEKGNTALDYLAVTCECVKSNQQPCAHADMLKVLLKNGAKTGMAMQSLQLKHLMAKDSLQKNVQQQSVDIAMNSPKEQSTSCELVTVITSPSDGMTSSNVIADWKPKKEQREELKKRQKQGQKKERELMGAEDIMARTLRDEKKVQEELRLFKLKEQAQKKENDDRLREYENNKKIRDNELRLIELKEQAQKKENDDKLREYDRACYKAFYQKYVRIMGEISPGHIFIATTPKRDIYNAFVNYKDYLRKAGANVFFMPNDQEMLTILSEICPYMIRELKLLAIIQSFVGMQNNNKNV